MNALKRKIMIFKRFVTAKYNIVRWAQFRIKILILIHDITMDSCIHWNTL